ncbi:MAG: acetate--CoA ligase family protein [Actinomycetota bacterium]
MSQRLDVSGRPLALREVDLHRFFHPRTIAVIGASDSPGSQAALNYRLLREWQSQVQEPATIYPVNPRRDEVAGERCYRSILDIPEDVDVAIILAPDPLDGLRQAIEKKAPFALVFGAGFAESGRDGAKRQAELERLIRESDTHVLGPNTTVNAFQPFRRDLDGKRLGLITQSGHQGRPIYQGQELGIPLQGWAPTGNEADLESADFIRHYADDPDVGAICGYIEGFRDGRTLMLAADHSMARGVPIVLVKPGKTDVGRSWVQSHTGHLAGSDAVLTGVCRQFGITRVDGLDELLEVSAMLARAKPPAGDGVAIYSISGGTGTHISDWASSLGLRLPELTRETQDRLHEWIPEFLRVSNPVDSGGIATGDERGPKILDAILEDPNVSVLVVPVAGSFSPISDRFAQDLVDAAARTDKPVCVIWGSPPAMEPGYRDVLIHSALPVFRSARNCLTAVKAYLDYHAFRRSYRSPFGRVPLRPLPVAARAREALAAGGGGALSERGSREVLVAYGIPVTRALLATSAAEAARAAALIRFPVVLKACSPNLLHKSDLGLVRIGLSSAREVRDAYLEITAAAEAAAPGEVEGVLVSEMASGGVETVVGVVRDELFGPAVMFGLGGIAVEVFGDVTFRVPPFTRADARRMVNEVRSAALLRGARGAPKADLGALVDVLMRVQRLALDLSEEILELDINPLLVTPREAVALDALVVGR